MLTIIKKVLYKKHCKSIIKVLSKKYHTSVPKLSFRKKEGNFIGHYDYEDNTIVLDLRKISSSQQLIVGLLHEYRHHWQWYHYRDQYMWWIKDDEHYNFYNKIYPYPIIEADAIRFSRSLGKKHSPSIISYFSTDDMDRLYNEKRLEAACRDMFNWALKN